MFYRVIETNKQDLRCMRPASAVNGFSKSMTSNFWLETKLPSGNRALSWSKRDATDMIW